MAMYTARAVMGWSLMEFWQATPALLDDQIKVHLRLHKPGKKGRKSSPGEAKKVQYIDQLPGQFW